MASFIAHFIVQTTDPSDMLCIPIANLRFQAVCLVDINEKSKTWTTQTLISLVENVFELSCSCFVGILFLRERCFFAQEIPTVHLIPFVHFVESRPSHLVTKSMSEYFSEFQRPFWILPCTWRCCQNSFAMVPTNYELFSL